jgi:TonB family protein
MLQSSSKALAVDSLAVHGAMRDSSAARVETGEGEGGGWRERAGVKFVRKLAGRYAVPVTLAAGLHAAVLFMPSEGWRFGSGDGEDAEAARLSTVGLSGDAWFDAASGGAQGGERGESSDGETSVPDADALAAAADEALAEMRAMMTGVDAAAFILVPANGGAGATGAGFGVSAGDLGTPAWRGGGAGYGGAGAFTGNPGASHGGSRLGGAASAAFMPDPLYPELARRERREGVVELAVGVGAHGRADWVGVAHSSGHADLDEAARNAVLRQWRFHRGGQAARECVVRITFSLDRG